MNFEIQAGRGEVFSQQKAPSGRASRGGFLLFRFPFPFYIVPRRAMMSRATTTPVTEACMRPRVTPAPSPMA